jgi:hemoglobin
MTSNQTASLYDKLGGEATISKVVDHFYKLVLADETVNRFFANTDMEKQRSHQTKFISYALGGPANYTGQSMAKVHTGMNLQPVHFDAIVRHLRDALAHFDVETADIDEALRTVGTLREDVLYK